MNSTIQKSENRAPAAPEPVYSAPEVNITETKDSYVLEAEMPGVNKDGLDISLEDNVLTLTGRQSGAVPPGTLTYRESKMTDYRRAFELDPVIDTARISARMDQGVLRLTLQKVEKVKPRKIAVTD